MRSIREARRRGCRAMAHGHRVPRRRGQRPPPPGRLCRRSGLLLPRLAPCPTPSRHLRCRTRSPPPSPPWANQRSCRGPGEVLGVQRQQLLGALQLSRLVPGGGSRVAGTSRCPWRWWQRRRAWQTRHRRSACCCGGRGTTHAPGCGLEWRSPEVSPPALLLEGPSRPGRGAGQATAQLRLWLIGIECPIFGEQARVAA